MNHQELWEKFREKNQINSLKYQVWTFGSDTDELLTLVLKGEKTATSSVYLFYELEREPLPTVGLYNVVLTSKGEAICILQTEKVSVIPFREVTEEHAYKEGEGNKTLSNWRESHREFFSNELLKIGKKFDENIKVVCEEFQLVYREGETL